MAAKVNYDELADAIIERLGGKDNISFHTHCVTRLRFNVKDKSLVDKEGIEALQGVINSLWSGEQYQIVIGNTVNEAYECVAAKLGPVDTTVSEDAPKKKFSFSTIFEIITGIFVPAIPAIAGCGLMKALLSLLTFANLLSTESQTYYILAFVADSAFYFLPMILAFNAANKFKCSPMLAVVPGRGPPAAATPTAPRPARRLLPRSAARPTTITRTSTTATVWTKRATGRASGHWTM